MGDMSQKIPSSKDCYFDKFFFGFVKLSVKFYERIASFEKFFKLLSKDFQQFSAFILISNG